MRLIRHRTGLLVGVLFLSLFLPLMSGSAQGQAALATLSTSRRKFLHDPNVKEEYKKWLKEDVALIITDEEMADFVNFSTDQQRDEFVVAFWERRNPSPGAAKNKLKEEHYQRLAYANTHFAADVPGWKTDRGRMYIMYGPPDSTESHPGFSPPSEIWRYSYIEGIGKDVTFDFVDDCRCGKYHMPIQSPEKDSPRIEESFPQP